MEGVAKFHKGGPPRLYTARFRPELIHFRPATGFRPASGGEVWRTLRVRHGKSTGLQAVLTFPQKAQPYARLLARSWERNARIRALGSQPPPSGSWVARGSGQAIRGIRLAILRQPCRHGFWSKQGPGAGA